MVTEKKIDLENSISIARQLQQSASDIQILKENEAEKVHVQYVKTDGKQKRSSHHGKTFKNKEDQKKTKHCYRCGSNEHLVISASCKAEHSFC